MDFDETNILDRNMKRTKAQGEGSEDEGRRTRGGCGRCENVFLAQDRKGDKGGEVEVIDMFVQTAEDCRDTTVEVMSEAVPQGDGRPGQCGDTTDERTATEIWLMSRGCAGTVGVPLSDRKYLL